MAREKSSPAREKTPTREANFTPIRAGVLAPRRSAPPRRDVPNAPLRASSPTRAPRRPRGPLLSKSMRGVVVGAVLACAALALLVDRGPLLWARATERVGPGIRDAASTATSFASDSWKSAVDSIATVGSDVESYGRMVAESATNAATDVAATANDVVRAAQDLSTRNAREELPPPDVAAASPEVTEPTEPAERAEPAKPAAAEPAAARPAAPRKPATPHKPAKPTRVAASAGAPIHVGINSDPWSDIAVDGVDFGSTPLSIPLSPGTHRFRAKMADGRVVEKEIEVAEGRNEVVFR